MDYKIHISVTDVPDCRKSINEIIKSGQLTAGKYIDVFENSLSRYVNSQIVAVNSGTAALITALMALGVKAKDEVIVPGFTFPGTINAIIHSGAVARVVDVSSYDYLINPECIQSAITRKTVGIVPVHLFGYTADMSVINQIAQKNKLFVIQDAAQALGSRINGEIIGQKGIATFSFYPSKLLTTGEGGAIATSDPEIYEFSKIFRAQGMSENYEFSMAGNNLRLPEISALIGLSQIDHLENRITQRAKNANVLNEILENYQLITLPHYKQYIRNSWHQYTILLDRSINRNKFIDHMKHLGIEVRAYYPKAAPDYPCFLQNPKVQCDSIPVSHDLAKSVVSLPIHHMLRSSDMEFIASSTKSVISEVIKGNGSS